MASGHENRAKQAEHMAAPTNCCTREENPCQPGAVATGRGDGYRSRFRRHRQAGLTLAGGAMVSCNDCRGAKCRGMATRRSALSRRYARSGTTTLGSFPQKLAHARACCET
jgi:hypothetical protein